MANKTQSGERFSARSLNGIIELDDGAGTLISGGVIQTNNITANNLLEADVNETITGKWTFSQTPYITQAPTDANDAVNKSYVDAITIESVLQQGNNANNRTMTGLSNLTMGAAYYGPQRPQEVSTKSYSDVFTGKIDATNNGFFSTIYLFNAPFQVALPTTIPVGIYTIQSLLTQIATSLASTFSATISPSVVITEWTYDITTNKVSARLPSNSTIAEVSHRLNPLLQLLGWNVAPINMQLLNNAPAVIADYPQHLPHLKDYVDDNFVDLTTNQSVAGDKTFTNIIMDSGYSPSTALQVASKQYVDDNFVGLLGTQTITGTKTFENAFMSASYTPVSARQLTTKEYVDDNFVDLTTNQSVAGDKTFTNIIMDSGYSPSAALQIATKQYVDSSVAGGGLTEALFFDSNGNSRFQK
jgi:hypothetical protein